mgnify:CR=1 FL=1
MVSFMDEKKQWYLEYELLINRPGLLGDIASLLGMLSINIITINGVDKGRRGLLILSADDQIKRLELILQTMESIRLIKLRRPTLRDLLAIRHGRYIQRDEDDKRVFRFIRDEIGLLVDFMSEIFKKDGHCLVGIRGMPRVGKTESVVAASVSANKRWLLISSTLLKQTVRDRLHAGEYSENYIYIIDGAVSKNRGSEKHWALIRELMRLPAVKVIEHPDLFVKNTEYTIDNFDYIIELQNDPSEKITYHMDKHEFFQENMFNGFDF